MTVFQCPVVWNYEELHKIKLKNIFGGWDSGYENTYSVPRLVTLDRVWCNSLPRLTTIANDVMRNCPFFIISFSKLKTYKHLLFLNSFNQSKIILGHFDILDYKTLHLWDFWYLNKQTNINKKKQLHHRLKDPHCKTLKNLFANLVANLWETVGVCKVSNILTWWEPSFLSILSSHSCKPFVSRFMSEYSGN